MVKAVTPSRDMFTPSPDRLDFTDIVKSIVTIMQPRAPIIKVMNGILPADLA